MTIWTPFKWPLVQLAAIAVLVLVWGAQQELMFPNGFTSLLFFTDVAVVAVLVFAGRPNTDRDKIIALGLWILGGLVVTIWLVPLTAVWLNLIYMALRAVMVLGLTYKH